MMKYEDIVKQLTLEEKAALLTGKDTFQSRDIPRLNIPSFFCSDGPHGVRKQLGAADHLGLNASQPATCFPVAAAMANSWDPGLAEIIGAALGEEAAALDVDILLGPGLNIKRSPLCGRNFEYFSEDPYLSGKMAAAYIRGIQSKGIAACPKHFAANNQELGRMINNSIVDERALREIYLTGFEIAVKEGNPRAIMTSYNLINGTYANSNRHLLVDILRNEWGYENLVVTDWGCSNDHVAGVSAGSGLEMPGPVIDSPYEIIDAVKSGKLDEAVLDKRIDELLGIALASRQKIDSFDIDEHHCLAQRAAEESIVLLKNENSILPLKAKTKVALIGDFAQTPRYQGAGSSVVNPTRLDSTLDCFEKAGLELTGFATGYDRLNKKNDELVKAAVELAGAAEVVLLYMGLTETSEVEGLDRANMRLPQNQIQLLSELSKANPNIVVVLFAGAAVEMAWAGGCKAILHGYLPGQAGAMAILNVISGRVNPSGKLAESYPIVYEDTPAFEYFCRDEKTSEYRESLYVGYRFYDTAEVPLIYPFGYGMSYTTFAYSDLRISDKAVQFTVTNTGQYAGSEIAQLYIACKDSEIFRPRKELKGFSKVCINAGESREVVIELDDKAFRYFNTGTNAWEIESAEYTVMVGGSSADIRLSGTIHIDGTNAPNPYQPLSIPSYLSGDIKHVPDDEFELLLGYPLPPKEGGNEFDRNSAICQMQHAKSRVARFVFSFLSKKKRKSEAEGKPNLNVLFVMHMPLWSISKMAGAFVSTEMVDGIVMAVNGHFFKGLGKIIGGFFRGRKKKRVSESWFKA